MTATSSRLDTGQTPLWTPDRRQELGRCRRCEWHPGTQGHHGDCPDAYRPATTDTDTAPIGTCGRCQQPNIPIVGVDRKGGPACADCTNEGGRE